MIHIVMLYLKLHNNSFLTILSYTHKYTKINLHDITKHKLKIDNFHQSSLLLSTVMERVIECINLQYKIYFQNIDN